MFPTPTRLESLSDWVAAAAASGARASAVAVGGAVAEHAPKSSSRLEACGLPEQPQEAEEVGVVVVDGEGEW